MEVKWNRNGNWLLTASRDHLLKLFDIRKMNQEMQTFRGHKKEACSESPRLVVLLLLFFFTISTARQGRKVRDI